MNQMPRQRLKQGELYHFWVNHAWGKITDGLPASAQLQTASQYLQQPHPDVSGILRAFADRPTNFLGYLKTKADAEGEPLAAYLERYRSSDYFADLPTVYQSLYETAGAPGQSYEAFLEEFAKQEPSAAQYPMGDNSYEVEPKALMANYFQNCGIPCEPNDVMISNSGFRTSYVPMIYSLMTEGVAEGRKPIGGTILAPKGRYQSLVLPMGMVKGHIEEVDKLDGAAITRYLAEHDDLRAIYLSSVNNAGGQVDSLETLQDIALAILEHNKAHPDKPVYVISDEVYRYSELDDSKPTYSIAAIDGEALGRPELGSMHRYTLTITSSSKTFGFASGRAGYATIGDEKIRAKMQGVKEELMMKDNPLFVKLTGLATFCLTPRSWVKNNSRYYAERLQQVEGFIDGINDSLAGETDGRRLMEVVRPEGGWYATLRFNKELLPGSLRNSMALSTFMAFHEDKAEGTGVATIPGILSGYESPGVSDDGYVYLRTTMAKSAEDIADAYARIKDACEDLVELKKQVDSKDKGAQARIDHVLEQVFGQEKAPALVR